MSCLCTQMKSGKRRRRSAADIGPKRFILNAAAAATVGMSAPPNHDYHVPPRKKRFIYNTEKVL